MTRTVADYLAAHEDWREVLESLRELLLATDLSETVKWGAPTYMLEGNNVVGLGAFKAYAGLWFFEGALLSDPLDVLVNAQPGKTQALRQWRFEPGQQPDLEQVRSYVDEAIANARAGRRVATAPAPRPAMPDLLAAALAADAHLARAFEGLPAGKQCEFMKHVGEAKQEATRRRRVEKILALIARGEGLNDRYRGRG